MGTALLYSTFDAWYKFEHEARRFPKEWVSSTFSKQAFGDSILAILSGLVASVATEYIGALDFLYFFRDVNELCGSFLCYFVNHKKVGKKVKKVVLKNLCS